MFEIVRLLDVASPQIFIVGALVILIIIIGLIVGLILVAIMIIRKIKKNEETDRIEEK